MVFRAACPKGVPPPCCSPRTSCRSLFETAIGCELRAISCRLRARERPEFAQRRTMPKAKVPSILAPRAGLEFRKQWSNVPPGQGVERGSGGWIPGCSKPQGFGCVMAHPWIVAVGRRQCTLWWASSGCPKYTLLHRVWRGRRRSKCARTIPYQIEISWRVALRLYFRMAAYPLLRRHQCRDPAVPDSTLERYPRSRGIMPE